MSISDNSGKEVIKQVENDITDRNKEKISRVLYHSRMSNRIEPSVFHKIKQRVIQEVANTIEPTLGPYGAKNLLQPRGAANGICYGSGDGWQGTNNLTYAYDDPIPHAIMFIVNDISNSMNYHVGDGTTSGIPIAKKLYNSLYDRFLDNTKTKDRISVMGLSNLLNALEAHLKENCVGMKFEETGKEVVTIEENEGRSHTEEIPIKKYKYNSKYVKELNKDDKDASMAILKRVAAVSAKNDEEIGEKISSLFDTKLKTLFPFVNLRMNDKEDGEDVIIRQSGFEFFHGYTDDVFANQPGGLSAIFENPKFAMFSGPILETDIKPLEELVSAVNFGEMNRTWQKIPDVVPSPLVIIAETFSPQVIKWGSDAVKGSVFTKYNNKTGEMEYRKAEIMFIKLSIQNPADMELFKDFEIATGSTSFDTMNGPLMLNKLASKEGLSHIINHDLGTGEKILATKLDCRVIGGGGREDAIAEQIKFIESQMKKHQMAAGVKPSDELLAKWRTRIDMLRADMNTILVGGNSYRDQYSRMSVYDDCVRSVKSTITTGGVSLGGNLAIPHYLKNNRETVKADILERLKKSKRNLAIGNKPEIIESNLNDLIDIIIDSFGEAYRRVLWNAFLDDEIVNEIWNNCISDPNVCKVYNMLSDKYDTLEDFENCDLIVPANTDFELLRAVFACVRQLTECVQMIALYSLDIKWDDFVKYNLTTGQGIWDSN